MLSLCVFPYVARPMLQTVVGFTDDDYTRMLAERKVQVTRFILDALKP